jgi:hypothetical protein
MFDMKTAEIMHLAGNERIDKKGRKIKSANPRIRSGYNGKKACCCSKLYPCMVFVRK